MEQGFNMENKQNTHTHTQCLSNSDTSIDTIIQPSVDTHEHPRPTVARPQLQKMKAEFQISGSCGSNCSRAAERRWKTWTAREELHRPAAAEWNHTDNHPLYNVYSATSKRLLPKPFKTFLRRRSPELLGGRKSHVYGASCIIQRSCCVRLASSLF